MWATRGEDNRGAAARSEGAPWSQLAEADRVQVPAPGCAVLAPAEGAENLTRHVHSDAHDGGAGAAGRNGVRSTPRIATTSIFLRPALGVSGGPREELKARTWTVGEAIAAIKIRDQKMKHNHTIQYTKCHGCAAAEAGHDVEGGGQ